MDQETGSEKEGGPPKDESLFSSLS